MEKKKNSSRFIIPPSYFKAKRVTPIAVAVPNQQNTEKQATSASSSSTNTIEEPEVKIPLTAATKRTSGLSLKSIRAKKEHQKKLQDTVIDQEDLPKEEFTEERFLHTWNAYIANLHKKGEKIMASILEMDKPKLKGTAVGLTFPNKTLKVELEQAQYPLMKYLRTQLRNFDIHLDITVNEEVSKKYVFTSIDKYEKLKEKNPNIELLMATFGLDIN